MLLHCTLYFVQNIYTLYNKDISHTSKLAPAYTHYLIVYTHQASKDRYAV